MALWQLESYQKERKKKKKTYSVKSWEVFKDGTMYKGFGNVFTRVLQRNRIDKACRDIQKEI